MGMTKTPDEIKKGLECCTVPLCAECPYDNEPSCVMKNADALALIQQLQDDLQLEKKRTDALAMELAVLKNAKKQLEDHLREATKKIEQLEAERDAAVADITRMVQEPYDPCYCDYCKLTEEECAKSNCRGRSAFVWRGVQREE